MAHIAAAHWDSRTAGPALVAVQVSNSQLAAYTASQQPDGQRRSKSGKADYAIGFYSLRFGSQLPPCVLQQGATRLELLHAFCFCGQQARKYNLVDMYAYESVLDVGQQDGVYCRLHRRAGASVKHYPTAHQVGWRHHGLPASVLLRASCMRALLDAWETGRWPVTASDGRAAHVATLDTGDAPLAEQGPGCGVSPAQGTPRKRQVCSLQQSCLTTDSVHRLLDCVVSLQQGRRLEHGPWTAASWLSQRRAGLAAQALDTGWHCTAC